MLDGPLTSKEIQGALCSLQTGKTFFKFCSDILVDELQEMLKFSLVATSLPELMSRAIIVVVPKPGKELKL